MKEKITANQFFLFFFLCSVYFLSTVSSGALRDNFSDSVLSAVISGGIGILLSLPVLLLHDKNSEFNAVTRLRKKFGGFSKVLLVFYGLYFFVADVVILTLMQSLLTSTVFPTVPALAIGLMAVGVAIYGAIKKTETVARASFFVFIIFILGIGAIFLGVIPLFRFENRQVLLYEGAEDMLSNSALIFARSTFIPQMFILLSFVKDKVCKKAVWWNVGVSGFIAVVFVFIIHSLGRFASTQLFPVYALSSVSQIAPFQRLDVVFTAVWLMSLVIRLSCDLLCIDACMKPMVPRKFETGLLFAVGALLVLVSFFFTNSAFIKVINYVTLPMGIAAVVLGFAIPAILMIGGKERK